MEGDNDLGSMRFEPSFAPHTGVGPRATADGIDTPTAGFSVVDPHCMMRTYGPAEGLTQPLLHAWRLWVNINATRCSFLEVVHSLFEDGVFVGHDRSIRTERHVPITRVFRLLA